MGLSRAQIVDTACATLRRHGLGGLSMRRLAQDLGVQHGALYYHVPSKQELLVAVAEQILSDGPVLYGGPGEILAADPLQAVCEIREALLRVRDSAEVVSFAVAYRPAALAPFGDLHRLFAGQLPPRQARWAARTLIHYMLGFVAEEQNQAELARAKILSGDPDQAESRAAFVFGVRAILRGLAAEQAPQAPQA
ncbi:MAG: TetR family transcriptional regulator [Actinomycetota bacterium]|nr:TetR family transcriptional regulator [Actinomycetota bacterium]